MSESGNFPNLSDGAGFGGIPYPQRTWKPYEVYEAYEVFCPLRDSMGTVPEAASRSISVSDSKDQSSPESEDPAQVCLGITSRVDDQLNVRRDLEVLRHLEAGK